MAQEVRNDKLRRIWWVVLTLATLIGLYMMDSKEANAAAAAQNAPIELKVVPLQKKDITSATQYIGYITPIHQVALVPNVSGYISQVFVSGGQDVKIGDKLVQIDPREYKAAYASAKAAQVQAQANFANAKVYYERIKKAGEKAVSKTEFDAAKAQFLSAQGALAQAVAEVEKAKVLLDYTLLQSSIDGTVGNVDLTIGNYVAPSTKALLSIVQYDPIRVVFSISDKDYLSQEGSLADCKIRLKLADGSVYNQSGIFQFTDNQINPATNSIAVYADFKNPQKELVANAYVDVLLEKEYKNAFVIPEQNAQLREEGTYVYIIRNNQLIKVSLKILATVDNHYVVANDFEKDDYLVADKVPPLDKQTKIKPKLIKAEE